MSGATREHIDITGNLYVALRLAFPGDGVLGVPERHASPGRAGRAVHVPPTSSALCDEAAFLDQRKRRLTNPALVVEVLSDSTEAYDRGKKLDAYREVPSVQEVVLVRQDRRAVSAYRREDDGRWTIEDLGGAATLALPSVGVDVTLDDLYEGTGL